MGPQHRLEVYVGFDWTSIITYLEPFDGDMFTACFANCDFNENIFPPLGKRKMPSEEKHELSWCVSGLLHFDLHTSQSEN